MISHEKAPHRLRYILCGSSGCGKSTMAKVLEDKLGLKRCITSTTRAPRPGEVHGTDYYFCNQMDSSQMFECSEFGKEQYGTSWSTLEQSDFIILDPQGVQYYRAHFPSHLCVIQLARSGISIDAERLLRDQSADFEHIYPDVLITGDTIEAMSAKLIAAVNLYEQVLRPDETLSMRRRILDIVSKGGWTEFQNQAIRKNENALCLQNPQYPYYLYFADAYAAGEFARTISYVSHLICFLEQHDSAFGYAAGLPGQETAEQFLETLRCRLFGAPSDNQICSLNEDSFQRFSSLYLSDLCLATPAIRRDVETLLYEAESFCSSTSTDLLSGKLQFAKAKQQQQQSCSVAAADHRKEAVLYDR